MSKRTIETHEKAAAKQAEQDRANDVLACTCSNPACGLTWIICLLPQPMATVALLTNRHRQCPGCGKIKPMLAKAKDVRLLLGDDA